ncbi:MAG: serine/threonine-protein phosphatase [Planctomycetaceae bacterium]|nr:serine/threonine-protein phosphatase [Planctomycetaceae bacterium]
MKILVGWEPSPEIETIELMLNVGSHEVVICRHAAVYIDTLNKSHWDAVLLSLDFPSADEATAIFKATQEALPTSPIVGVIRNSEFARLIEYISDGLHSHIIRDDDQNFIMLLISILEAAEKNVRALRDQVVAERLSEEVRSVRKLQESVVPKDLPKLRDYSVVGRYEPSEIRVDGRNVVVMAGGDYYDSFALNDDQLVMLVGDASGHGVKACMSIMTMHTLIRMIRENRFIDTAEFVGAVNERLCRSDIAQDEGGFITLLYSILDTSTHQLQWTCAGHPLPLLQNMDTNEISTLGDEDQIGLPLAVMQGWNYECLSAHIPPRSRVLLYTDGLDEAFPPEGDALADQFGVAGITDALKESINMSLDDAMNHLFNKSTEITAGAGRHDDTSVMMIERK